MTNGCYDCAAEKELLYSTCEFTKHGHSVAVCKECFKKRRGEYPDKINKSD